MRLSPSLSDTAFKFVQLRNVALLIFSTFAGNVTLVRLVQSLKAFWVIVVTDSGISISVKLVQPLKLGSIVIFVESFICLRFVQPSKAPASMKSVVSGKLLFLLFPIFPT